MTLDELEALVAGRRWDCRDAGGRMAIEALPALLAIARVAAETADACEWTDDAMVASGVTCGHCGPCRMDAQLAALEALR